MILLFVWCRDAQYQLCASGPAISGDQIAGIDKAFKAQQSKPG